MPIDYKNDTFITDKIVCSFSSHENAMRFGFNCRFYNKSKNFKRVEFQHSDELRFIEHLLLPEMDEIDYKINEVTRQGVTVGYTLNIDMSSLKPLECEVYDFDTEKTGSRRTFKKMICKKNIDKAQATEEERKKAQMKIEEEYKRW